MARQPSDLIVFVGSRFLQFVPVRFGVIAVTFFFTHIAVSNPCLGWAADARPDVV